MSPVNPNELLARFIFHKSGFSSSKQKVAYAAFLPNSTGKTSVFRISKLPNNGIWNTGNAVAQKRGIPVLGRADIQAAIVFDQELQIDPNDNPPGHADIIGWPTDKSKQKLKALELAKNSTLHIKEQ